MNPALITSNICIIILTIIGSFFLAEIIVSKRMPGKPTNYDIAMVLILFILLVGATVPRFIIWLF